MYKRIVIILSVSLGMIILHSIIGVMLRPSDSPASSTAAKLKVVAAENVWGDIAAQIGGEHVEVTSFINDTATDPHLFEPSVADAAALSIADVAIVNGAGYDDFMTRLLNASPNNKRIVINVADLLHAKAGDNPHLWYRLADVNVVATNILQAYTVKNSTHTDAYRAAYNTFIDQLLPVLDNLQTLQKKGAHLPVASTERLAGYLIAAANLTDKTPSGFATAIEDGTEPSPAEQAAFEALINKKQIKALLYNVQTETPATKAIKAVAEKNNLPVVTITEIIPNEHMHYQDWQQSQITQLKQALGVQ